MWFVLSILDACKKADEKPNDNRRKRIATIGASSLPQQLAIAPAMTASALELTSYMCDITAITKKATETSRKASSNIQLNAAMHGKLYRPLLYYPSIEDKALKLVINVLFPK